MGIPLKSTQQQENEHLRRESAKVKMERDILKKRWASSRKSRREVCLHCSLSAGVAHTGDVPAAA